MPKPLVDLKKIDFSASTHDVSQIEDINPHRYEFRLLDRVIYVNNDPCEAVGSFQVLEDQYWVKGHIPGRPLFPGVLQIEAAAQLCSILASQILEGDTKKFFGFVGVDKIKFRRQVVPGNNLIIVAKLIESRRVTRFDVQEFVDDKMVFSGEIIGSHI